MNKKPRLGNNPKQKSRAQRQIFADKNINTYGKVQKECRLQ